MKKLLVLASIMLFAASLSYGQSNPTGTTSLSVSVGAEAAIVVNTATTTFLPGTGAFADYAGNTSLTYYVRTLASGAITLKVGEFAQSGGPSIGHPATGDELKYTPTVSLPGTTAGLQTALLTDTPVASFGANQTSAKGGNSASVAWDLPNDPIYLPNTYTATVTFTISAV